MVSAASYCTRNGSMTIHGPTIDRCRAFGRPGRNDGPEHQSRRPLSFPAGHPITLDQDIERDTLALGERDESFAQLIAERDRDSALGRILSGGWIGVPGQQRARFIPGEIVGPIGENLLAAALFRPCDVTSELLRRRQVGLAAAGKGRVSRRKFALQDADAPAVDQNVVKAPDHKVLGRSKFQASDPKQKVPLQIEWTDALGLYVALDRRFLFRFCQHREVAPVQAERPVFQDDLQRPIGAAGAKYSAQDVVTGDQPGPAAFERRDVERAAHPKGELLKIGTLRRITVEAEHIVIEQAFLERRQWKNVLDIVAAGKRHFCSLLCQVRTAL